jgi:agmatinase
MKSKRAAAAPRRGGHQPQAASSRLIEDEHVPGKNFVQVGLRGFYPDNELIEWMREQGMRSHFMAEVERYGLERTVDRVVAEALDGPEYLYLSFDIDVLDPAYAPGTGTPEPGGFTTGEIFPVVRRLCHEAHVVGMEVVEVAPAHDPTYVTALNANRVILEALTGLAMRKQGLPTSSRLDLVTSGEEAFPRPTPTRKGGARDVAAYWSITEPSARRRVTT